MLAVWILAAQAATGNPKTTAEDYVQANQGKIVRELLEALLIPNVASDRGTFERRRSFLVTSSAAASPRRSSRPREPARLRRKKSRKRAANDPLLHSLRRAAGQSTPLEAGESLKPILRDGRMEDGAKEIPGLTRSRNSSRIGGSTRARLRTTPRRSSL
jgi:hypothetical protein